MYVQAPKLIKEHQSNWLNLLMSSSFLGFFCRGLELNQQDNLKLTLHSRVHGCGEKELDYLLDCYEKTLIYLGIETRRLAPTGQDFRHLQVKGPRLQTLLGFEEGIHLFHPPNENALPIQVSLNQVETETLNIIRSYALPADDGKGGVLTDLRSGMLNRSGIQAHEWALLWYANLPEDERL